MADWSKVRETKLTMKKSQGKAGDPSTGDPMEETQPKQKKNTIHVCEINSTNQCRLDPKSRLSKRHLSSKKINKCRENLEDSDNFFLHTYITPACV